MTVDPAPQPPARQCYACGSANEHGLHMQFRLEGDRTICDYDPPSFASGYPGRMHGGGEGLARELRMPARCRIPAHIDQLRDAVAGQQRDEVFDRLSGMADGEEWKHALIFSPTIFLRTAGSLPGSS